MNTWWVLTIACVEQSPDTSDDMSATGWKRGLGQPVTACAWLIVINGRLGWVCQTPLFTLLRGVIALR
jgi:hypothetical protein